MVRRLVFLFGAVTAMACLPATAVGDWMDNFDSYDDGQLLYHVGGWTGWNDDPDLAGVVLDGRLAQGDLPVGPHSHPCVAADGEDGGRADERLFLHVHHLRASSREVRRYNIAGGFATGAFQRYGSRLDAKGSSGPANGYCDGTSKH